MSNLLNPAFERDFFLLKAVEKLIEPKVGVYCKFVPHPSPSPSPSPSQREGRKWKRKKAEQQQYSMRGIQRHLLLFNESPLTLPLSAGQAEGEK
jgi:hypothetical protein